DCYKRQAPGFSPTITTSAICPELTTKGLFRKGWVRMGDILYLLKSDKTKDCVNTRMEVLASEILECFENRIDSVTYVSDMKNMMDGEGQVSICKNFVGEDYSFVEAWEVMDYCRRLGINYREYCMEQWGEAFAGIPVLDYIIVNTDRHTQNYGFMMNNETGKIERLAPLFDFNCALVADYFAHDARDTLSQMFNTAETLRELAYQFREHTKIVFNEEKFIKVVERNEKYKFIFEQVYARIQEMGLA
ncbi:MAG: HipA domain-containing protein, partial [Lachnospiraceae bacterium]|nr:HipA domain-containing protein [Lachnospiraceae bacterium]